MLKKLQIKFVAIIMASVAVVLAIVFSGICFAEYQRAMSDVDQALSSSLEKAGNAPYGGGRFATDGYVQGGAGGNSNGQQNRYGSGTQQVRSDEFGGPRIGGGPDESRSLVPVAVYTQGDAGELVVISSMTTALIDDDVLASASSVLAEAQEGSGHLSDLGLLYQKRVIEGTAYVAFADATYASSWQSLAITLAVAALLMLAVFFVIALLLSRWALKPVEEAWTSQRQFVADASHELKTPLTVVLANASILLKHPESTIASQSQWIESTQVEAESMQGLVNEMLELAQVESRANVHHEQLDLSDLVAGVALQFESVAFEHGCTFEDEIEEGIAIEADATRVRKMTSTLIENALKYVEEGGRVDVALSARGSTALLSIHNTGSTISAEDLPHIFDRFYRTDKARTSGAGGFGLGLAIAREIAREHDGDITCESDAEGTTFTVTLPIA